MRNVNVLIQRTEIVGKRVPDSGDAFGRGARIILQGLQGPEDRSVRFRFGMRSDIPPRDDRRRHVAFTKFEPEIRWMHRIACVLSTFRH